MEIHFYGGRGYRCVHPLAMDISGFIWIFVILMVMQPMLKQRLLESSRRRLIAQFEKKRSSRVILLVHRQETMSILGFPVLRYVDVHDSEEILRALHLTDPNVPLDLVLHTPGGLFLSALQIARAVKRHKGHVTVFVPHYAMSGGALIALAADQIVMCEDAVLGPVDPQLGQKSAASVLAAVAKKPVDKVDDETLMLADQAEKAIRQVRSAVTFLLTDRLPPTQTEELAELLTRGAWTHDHGITPDDAREMGLPVETDIPHEILQLMDLYPQPVRRQPSVEYLPEHHPAPVPDPANRQP